jgi:hypothetical protein
VFAYPPPPPYPFVKIVGYSVVAIQKNTII